MRKEQETKYNYQDQNAKSLVLFTNKKLNTKNYTKQKLDIFLSFCRLEIRYPICLNICSNEKWTIFLPSISLKKKIIKTTTTTTPTKKKIVFILKSRQMIFSKFGYICVTIATQQWDWINIGYAQEWPSTIFFLVFFLFLFVLLVLAFGVWDIAG